MINFVHTKPDPIMMKRILPAYLAILFAYSSSAQVTTYSVGQTVNDFTVTDTHGNVHNLYSITASGKYVLLDFFFAACPPCQATQPYFNQLHETYGCNEHDLFVLSINQGVDNNAQVDQYEATYGGSYAHGPAVAIEGGCAAVKNAFGIQAYPTYCLIGPDNKLKNGDIWPVSSMQHFVNAFPAGSNIQTATCSLVGIAEQAAVVMDRLYPNPGAGTFRLELALGTSGQVTLEVMDALGRTVKAESMGMCSPGSFTHTMELGALSDGYYTLRLLLDGIPQIAQRLVIAR